MYNPNNPLIVQDDHTILVEAHHPDYEEVRDLVGRFAELEKSPEHIHTYKVSPLSLWNAAASGFSAESIVECLINYSRYDVPQAILAEIRSQIARYGLVKLVAQAGQLILMAEEPSVLVELANSKRVQPFICGHLDENQLLVEPGMRGHLKHTLIRLGFPVEDLAGYEEGQPLSVSMRSRTLGGETLALRDYQREAVEAFYARGGNQGGSGVIVLPCGAGKTITGIAAMAKIQSATLILTTGITALRQWRAELLDKTHLSEEQIGEYSGEVKDIKPVTITTYQILTHRSNLNQDFPHLHLFTDRDWGFVIYDEVHLLPAPVFRMTAEIQAKRRLGLTATLVREDGLEEDVFSLIGPKKYDVPWKVLERQNWIAQANCQEIRIPMSEHVRMNYALADPRKKFRIAAENPKKLEVVQALLAQHQSDRILIIGQYINQLEAIAAELELPVITGKMSNPERIRLYEDFNRGHLRRLVVSKVANFALDLPDANVAIQISGTFGSRQEEAQRLGRILRPKAASNVAYFYTLVTADSREQEFAIKRQLFLAEQGYRYTIVTKDELEVMAQ